MQLCTLFVTCLYVANPSLKSQMKMGSIHKRTQLMTLCRLNPPAWMRKTKTKNQAWDNAEETGNKQIEKKISCRDSEARTKQEATNRTGKNARNTKRKREKRDRKRSQKEGNGQAKKEKKGNGNGRSNKDE